MNDELDDIEPIEEEEKPRKIKKLIKAIKKTSLKKKIKAPLTTARKLKMKPKAKPKPVSRRRSVRDDREEYEAEILRAIRRYISIHPQYIELMTFPGGLIIGVATQLIVNKPAGGSMFQPFESTEKRNCFLNYIVEYSEYSERTHFIHELFKTGCPVVETYHTNIVKEVLDGLR